MKESNIPEVTTTEQEGDPDSHTVEHEHNTKFELIRLAVMAVALVLSWFDVWKSIASFDIIALAITIIGGYPAICILRITFTAMFPQKIINGFLRWKIYSRANSVIYIYYFELRVYLKSMQYHLFAKFLMRLLYR